TECGDSVAAWAEICARRIVGHPCGRSVPLQRPNHHKTLVRWASHHKTQLRVPLRDRMWRIEGDATEPTRADASAQLPETGFLGAHHDRRALRALQHLVDL